MYSTSVKRFYVILFATVCASLVLIVSILSIKILAEREQVQFAENFLSRVKSISIETRKNLATLNSYDTNGICDEALLRSMHQLLFKSRHAKEIAYYYNELQVCNTTSGILAKALATSTPDILRDADRVAWINKSSKLFDTAYPIYVVKDKHYHIVLDPIDIVSVNNPQFKWQWVYKSDEYFLELHGAQNLFIESVNKPESFYNMTRVMCPADIDYCIATDDQLSRHFSSNILMLLGLAFISAFIVFSWLGNIVVEYSCSIELRIKRGLKHKRFYPVYQPIVELATGEVIGCEVLARFEDDFGRLNPDEFIPIVSKLDRTVPFTRSMFKAAMSDLLKQPHLAPCFKVNFNIFPNDLTMENYERLAKQQDFFSSRFQLCFEITEDEPFRSEMSQLSLRKLKELGAEIAIDDFGTGYSNLTQLQSIPFDYLKVDKSFCVGLERNAFRASLIPQIAKIAQTLDVPVVAEGVETLTQKHILIKEGIKFAQGFLFSKPLSAPDLNSLLMRQTTL